MYTHTQHICVYTQNNPIKEKKHSNWRPRLTRYRLRQITPPHSKPLYKRHSVPIFSCKSSPKYQFLEAMRKTSKINAFWLFNITLSTNFSNMGIFRKNEAQIKRGIPPKYPPSAETLAGNFTEKTHKKRPKPVWQREKQPCTANIPTIPSHRKRLRIDPVKKRPSRTWTDVYRNAKTGKISNLCKQKIPKHRDLSE